MGTGYVGLVTGACFAELGLEVVAVDTNHQKIDLLNRGGVPIYEPGLQELIKKNVVAGRLRFSTDIARALSQSSIIFIAVGTPPKDDAGEPDLSYVWSAAQSIAKHATKPITLVTKSTVPVDTAKKLEAYIQGLSPSLEFDVVSNPEFLREGSAIEDFMRPDRIIIGCRSQRAEAVMRALYAPFSEVETPLLFMSPESAELTKYAANSFLATKITFINEVANLAEECGGNIQDIALGIGLDHRIGKKFLLTGPGYGGSCFPKDTRAMAGMARSKGTPLTVVEAVIQANEDRKRQMAQKIEKACGGVVKGKTIAVLGVTFKAETDDMRDSPSLVILPALQAKGAHLKVYDPAGEENGKRLLSQLQWCPSAQACLEGADALVILTDWNEFKALDWKWASEKMRTLVVVDLRNLYDAPLLTHHGFTYHALGKAPALPPDLP